jgi:thiol:disulfide interchange protein
VSRWSIGVVAICAAGGAIWYVASWRVPPSAVGWREDYEGALREAKQGGRLVLLDFYANWCGPCRAMEREVFSRPELAGKIERLVIPVKVDLSAERRSRAATEVAGRFDVSVVPTFLVIDGNERVVARRSGSMSGEQFLQLLESAAAGDRQRRSPGKD